MLRTPRAPCGAHHMHHKQRHGTAERLRRTPPTRRRHQPNRPQKSRRPAPSKSRPRAHQAAGAARRRRAPAAGGGRGRGEGRGRGRGRGGDAPPAMPRVRDVLEHSVTMIDDHDGTALRRMPKGAEVPMQQAVRDFVRRDMSTPGPTTYVYVPPSVGRDYEQKPPPRSIDELIDYTNTTQHVDAVTDERCAAPVDFAWSVLACVEINQ